MEVSPNVSLTLWHPAGFGDFREKKRQNARGFALEFLRYGMLYRSGKKTSKCTWLCVGISPVRYALQIW